MVGCTLRGCDETVRREGPSRSNPRAQEKHHDFIQLLEEELIPSLCIGLTLVGVDMVFYNILACDGDSGVVTVGYEEIE